MSDQAATTEILRLQCLQALGITVYHPRFRLPGAKPSVLGPLAEIATAARADSKPADAVAPARMERSVQPAPQRGDARTESQVQGRGAFSATSASTSASATSASASASASVSTASAIPAAARTVTPTSSTLARTSATDTAGTAAPRAADAHASIPLRMETGAQVAVQNFQLLLLQVDDDLAILNQIPALARPQLQDRQVALLTNLLRWLGKPMPAQTPRMFRWPLPGLEHMAASMSAGTSLLHFLEQASSERGFRFLLALGPQAVASASPGWQTFATHSVDEMLALPALKREAWQALLPLHALLASSSAPASYQTER